MQPAVLTPTEQHREALAAAQWKVNFRQALLNTHRGMASTTLERKVREKQLRDDLESAQKEMERIRGGSVM